MTIFALLAVFSLAPASAQNLVGFAQQVDQAVVCAVDSADPPVFDGPSCEMLGVNNINPQGRRIWLGATITLPAHFLDSEQPVAIHLGAMASSKLYWNGELIAVNGDPGTSKLAEEPGKLDAAFFVPRRLLTEGQNQVAIQLSSFHNFIPVRTPFHYLYVRSATTTAAPLAFYYVPALLTAGAFALAALYFGLLSFSGRQKTGAIFIALMALFAGAQLFAESLRAFAAYDYPWQVWRLIAVAFCAAGFALSMTAYVTRRFQPGRWKTYTAIAAMFIPLAVFAPGFDAKALWSLFAPLIITLIAIASPAIKGEKGARITGAALVVFFALIVIDGQNFLDRSFYLAAAGLTLVLFADQARAMRALKKAELEIRGHAERMELELLRRKIAPHFLMNTLNALVEWVESDPKTGVKMIEALAEEFRLLSQMSDRDLIPLADEIALCRRHLEVMSYRTDRAFTFAVQDVDEQIKVPPGVIHTLIENAFTHGRFADGAEFTLREARDGKQITLTFETPPSTERNNAGTGPGGEGLAYVIKRLKAAFGEAASFSDGPNNSGGWLSMLSFERGE